MPTTVQFPPAVLGNTETPEAVTLFNTGTTNIDISSIVTTGDFPLVNNQCAATLNAGTQCNVTVTFSPTAGGLRQGTITISDDSPGNPHVIQLVGTGDVPGLSIKPSSLTFPSQPEGSTSAAQNVTLQNTGGANLGILHIATAGDFAESNNCGLNLSPGQTCQISVTFTPTSVGTLTGTLTITDSLGNQIVGLTGTGAVSLGLGIPSGGSSSATVNTGATAKYTLAIGGGGLSGTATLTCTGAPMGATCTLPGSENLNANSATQFTVSVTTTPPSSATNFSPSIWFWATPLFGLVWLPFASRSRKTLRYGAIALSLMLTIFLASCGGASGNTSGGGGSGGTHTLMVTATMGSTKQSQTLKLSVN